MLFSFISLAREIRIIHARHLKWLYIIDTIMSLMNIIKLSLHKIIEPTKRFLRQKSIMPREKVTSHQALEWCQNFLGGAWLTITVEQVHIDRITGGLSNYLYCCSLPDDVEIQNNEPRKVLLRIYGESHRQHRGTLLIDSVVCALLSDRKIGPRVHGVFPDGRLEEFVEADSLLASELRNEDVSRKLGGLLGELHQLDMPLVKEPIWLFRTMEQYLSDLPSDISKFQNDQDRQIFQELRSVCNFGEEFEELKKLLSTIDSPVCFTHNDYQPGNILRLKSEPENFTVIDFEYCSYNYRGFDIGNHFCEFMFDYKSPTKWPHFKVDFTLFPNKNQQMNFITSYIDAITRHQTKTSVTVNGMTENSCIDKLDTAQDELARQIMKEANYFVLASHFLWTLWSINMAVSTSIKFGYMEYGRARLTAYYLQRDMLTGANDKQDIKMPPQYTEELLRSSKNRFHQTYIQNNQ